MKNIERTKTISSWWYMAWIKSKTFMCQLCGMTFLYKNTRFIYKRFFVRSQIQGDFKLNIVFACCGNDGDQLSFKVEIRIFWIKLRKFHFSFCINDDSPLSMCIVGKLSNQYLKLFFSSLLQIEYSRHFFSLSFWHSAPLFQCSTWRWTHQCFAKCYQTFYR